MMFDNEDNKLIFYYITKLYFVECGKQNNRYLLLIDLFTGRYDITNKQWDKQLKYTDQLITAPFLSGLKDNPLLAAKI